jgi:hypothetical protein
MQDIEDVSNFTEPVPGLQDAVDALNEANLNAVFQALANRTRKLKDDQTAHASTPAPHSGHETPVGAQAKVDAHDDLTAPHSATATPIANRLPKYDASGRLEAIAGIAGNDVVNFGQFVAAKTASGYQKLPGGLILQWGTYWGTVGGNGSTGAIPLPVTFPIAALVTVTGANTSDIIGDAAEWGHQTTKSTITLYNVGNGSRYNPTYFIIGY